jgi:hypothetical protein
MRKHFKEDLKALLQFYLYSDSEDEEYVIKYLEEEGIDLEEACSKLEQFIKQKRAELLTGEGREFHKNYIKLIVQNAQKDKATEDHLTGDINFALAYRKKTDGDNISGEPDEPDSKKMDLIRKAKERSKN